MSFNTGFMAPTSTAPSFGFGTTTPATQSSFGAGFSFSAPTSTQTPFGQTTNTGTTGFNLGGTAFGATTSTPSTGFGTFGTTPAPAAPSTGFGSFGATPASSAPSAGFGTFGTAPTASVPSTGFGFGTLSTASTAPTATGGLFSGFGQPQAQQPSTGFGGFSSFGAKPLGTSTFGSFANTGTTFGSGLSQPQQQQQQQQQAPNLIDEINSAVFNVNIFGDERDTTLAKWNLLQALWGTGKGYYAQNKCVDFNQDNPLCRFKAVGYSVKPTSDNKEGLVALTINKKDSDIRAQESQLINSLSAVLGNKPNLSVTIESIKSLSDEKSQVIITVQEKGVTSSVRKIPATELTNYLLQPMQKNNLSQMGVESFYPQVSFDDDQLKEYLENPPAGIDPRLWKQAIQDNPDPSKFIPVPIVGFSELRRRMKCQEQETVLHQASLDKIADEIQQLQHKQSATVAKTTEYRRKLIELQHRILQLLVKQEVTRKVGLALTPEEEAIRGHLESLQPHLYAPTHLKGRLAELLSTIRMQREKGEQKEAERYTVDPAVQDDIKQFLIHEQNGIEHLVQTVQQDLLDLRIIKEGTMKLLHRQ